MKVEVLYVTECPSHPVAVKLVKDVLAAEGIAADVHEILIADEEMAKKFRFCGSPTIRINGRDIAEEMQKTEAFALSCRLYPGLQQIGVPRREAVLRAVAQARGGDRK